MRILHLTDLHFGTESGDIVAHLYDTLENLAFNLVVISGDFTQIGSRDEFITARDFIKAFAVPVICVPGNHDVPRYNLIERFLNPFHKYQAYISSNLSPVFKDQDIILVGINTARGFLPHMNWANGAISQHQLDFLENTFADAGQRCRVCVMHHPIQKAEKSPLKVKVFGAQKAMQKIKDLKIDLVLTGHVHHASITLSGPTIFASASTAISSRIRSQGNGFNIIDIHERELEITHYNYQDNIFSKSSSYRHERK